MNSKIDEYLNNAGRWQQEMSQLRAVALDCGLREEVKWNQPCYTFQGSNIVIIHGFNDFCALMFFKGALLDDPENILEKPGKHSRAARRVPFTDVKKIGILKSTLRAYIKEAIEAEKAGKKIDLEKRDQLEIPEEFQIKLDENPDLKTAFESLTPGRQRAYLLHFTGAKQSQTRERRVEKYIPKILDGKGMQD